MSNFVDIRDFEAQLRELSPPELKKVRLSGLRKFSNSYVQKIRRNFLRTGIKSNILKKSIRYKILKDNQTSVVAINGKNSKNTGYKMVFFEGGTVGRYRRYRKKIGKKNGGKSVYAGKIKGYYFFRDATNEVVQGFPKFIEEYYDNYINKLKVK